MRVFLLLLPPFPFPQPRPALVTLRSPVVAAALIEKDGRKDWVEGVWSWEGGLRDAGARGDGRGRAAVLRERAPSPLSVSSTFLSEAAAATAGDSPKGCQVDLSGEGLGEQTCQQPGTCRSS